jgi:hypothetical protein
LKLLLLPLLLLIDGIKGLLLWIAYSVAVTDRCCCYGYQPLPFIPLITVTVTVAGLVVTVATVAVESVMDCFKERIAINNRCRYELLLRSQHLFSGATLGLHLIFG